MPEPEFHRGLAAAVNYLFDNCELYSQGISPLTEAHAFGHGFVMEMKPRGEMLPGSKAHHEKRRRAVMASVLKAFSGP